MIGGILSERDIVRVLTSAVAGGLRRKPSRG